MDGTRDRAHASKQARRAHLPGGVRPLFTGAVLTALVLMASATSHAQSGIDRPSFGDPELDREPQFDEETPRPKPRTTRPPTLGLERVPEDDELPEAVSPSGGPADEFKFPSNNEPIVRIRVEGNVTIPESAIVQQVRTRPDRPASEPQVREDVRALYGTRWFYSVEPKFVRGDKGLELVFVVLERPIVRKVEFQGRKKIKEKYLTAETGLRVGSPFDVSANREAARRLENYYHEKGYAFATVELAKGDQPDDREVVFRIYEGPKVRVTSVKFEGNKDFSDALLTTKLQTKKALLWVFGGKYDPASVPDDVTALKQYYHSLGYFDVKIDHRVGFSESRERAHLEYFIDEGVRYKVRNVELEGNRIFTSDDLRTNLKLTEGKYFNSRHLDKDVDGIKSRYGEQGRLFARIDAEPRFLSTPGEADLVYRIDEDKPYIIGRINVQFNNGDDSHTKRSVVLNTIRVKSGDMANPKLFEKSKRALSGSQLFEGGADGPRIRITRRDDEVDPDDEVYRGQDGIPRPGDRARLTHTAGRAATAPQSSEEDEKDEETVAPAPPPGYRSLNAPQPRSSTSGQPRPAPLSTSLPARTSTSRTVSPWTSAPVAPAPADARRQATASPENASGFTTIPDPFRSQAAASFTPAVPPTLTAPQKTPTPGTADSGLTWTSVDPREAFVDVEPTFIFRAQNAFEGPIPAPQNPIFGNSPQGDPFNNRLIEPTPGVVDLDVDVTEARTGRLMFGVGVNSDAGVVGSIVLTEQNFDIMRPPTSFRDIVDGTAWRGAGQKFRLEAVPGNVVSRYAVSWTDPFFMDTEYSLGLSGFYYNRFLPDWTEERAGGRVSLGRQLTPTLSVTGAIRLEAVELSDPNNPTPPLLQEAVGSNFLSTGRVSVAHDTRDAPFLPGEGHYINASYEQAFGDYTYPRLELEASQYFTLYARPDGGGRHILTLASQFGWTGNDTPIFERFFAGGFQTFRGFAFRGVGPVDQGVRIGGEFLAVGTIEYMFPVMANEMIQLVAFSDIGTVEDSVGFGDLRVSVGGGLRITVPAMGPVPLAFDWGIPILREDTDDTRLFSFYVGLQR